MECVTQSVKVVADALVIGRRQVVPNQNIRWLTRRLEQDMISGIKKKTEENI
jgi:hypothetical protein